MEQEPVSFWTEIKKYEDMLEADPDSFCFAPLAELYRKSGLLDEAIRVAKQGVEKHPDYVGGLIALGRASFDNGLKQESRQAFEKVVAMTPDNLLALKALGRLFMDMGDHGRAQETFRKVLVLNPDDREGKDALESLEGLTPPPVEFPTGPAPEPKSPVAEVWALAAEAAEPEEELEEVEVLEGGAEVGDESIFEEFAFEDGPADVVVVKEQHPSGLEERGPIPTITLAEMYISQGYHKRAMTVFMELLKADPVNEELKRRLFELKRAIDEDVDTARREALKFAEEERETLAAPAAAFEVAEEEAAPAEVAESPLATLERWLENVRRRKHGV